MSTLERYQRDVIAYLYAGRAGAPLPSLMRRSAPAERVELGLTIHRRNLILAVCRALAATYPICRGLLGEGNFKFLCKAYVHRHPSRVRDLADYGERGVPRAAARGPRASVSRRRGAARVAL